MNVSTIWDRPHATEKDVRWAISRGYLAYITAFFSLIIATAAALTGRPMSVALTCLGISATFGWVGAMLQIHAIAWAKIRGETGD